MAPPEQRAAMHRALGDEHRVLIVDRLAASDLTPGELGELTGLSSNLLAFHLRTLEDAGIVERRRSEGDSRRRYVRRKADNLALLTPVTSREPTRVVFVCTHNSARSQFAEALWRERQGGEVWSAGTNPASEVYPGAMRAARRFGVDLTGMRPKGYEAIPEWAELIITVCDRALESGVPLEGTRIHWSIPDPVGGGEEVLESSFTDIASRIERLGRAA